MKTVKEVSNLTGISVHTLHYYDEIGLLKPTGKSEAGYRLYDDKALEILQMAGYKAVFTGKGYSIVGERLQRRI